MFPMKIWVALKRLAYRIVCIVFVADYFLYPKRIVRFNSLLEDITVQGQKFVVYDSQPVKARFADKSMMKTDLL